MLKCYHWIVRGVSAYISGGLPQEELKGIRLYLYKLVSFVDVVRKKRKEGYLNLSKELVMGVLDKVVPGLGIATQLLELMPKGNKRKAGAALANQLEIQLAGMVDIVVQVAENSQDPMQKFALLQHANQLASLKELADSISDILIGEDDLPGK